MTHKLPKHGVCLQNKELQLCCNSIISGLKKFRKEDLEDTINDIKGKRGFSSFEKIILNVDTEYSENDLENLNYLRDVLKSMSNIYFESTGYLAVVEGCDYVGKSTYINKLKEESKNKFDVLFTTAFSRPFGITSKKLIGDNALDKYSKILLEMSFHLDNTIKTIIPAMESGSMVICDRFFLSSLIYDKEVYEQDKDYEEFLKFVNDASNLVLHKMIPDLWLILYEDINVIKQRMEDSEESLDELEKLIKSTMLEKINNSYMYCGSLETMLIKNNSNTPLPTISDLITNTYNGGAKFKLCKFGNNPSITDIFNIIMSNEK